MAYRRLTAAPDLDHLKNQAKRLLAAFREGDPAAVAEFSALHPGQAVPLLRCAPGVVSAQFRLQV